MRIVSPKEFSRLYKRDRKNRVFIYGSETAFVRKTLEIVKRSWGVPSESITELYGGKELSLADLSSLLFGGSLFSEESLVILKDVQGFYKTLYKKEKEQFEELLGSIPESTCFVMVQITEEDTPKGEHPLLKVFEKVDGFAVYCRRARANELRAWLKKKLEKMGLEDDALVDVLIEASGGSMEVLNREIEKLVVGLSKDVLSRGEGVSIHALADTLFKSGMESLEVLERLLAMDVPLHSIIAYIEGHLRNLLLYSAGAKSFPPFVRSKFDRLLEVLGQEKVKYAYERAVDLEKKSRLSASGSLLKKLVEDFLIECSLLVQKI